VQGNKSCVTKLVPASCACVDTCVFVCASVFVRAT